MISPIPNVAGQPPADAHTAGGAEDGLFTIGMMVREIKLRFGLS